MKCLRTTKTHRWERCVESVLYTPWRLAPDSVHCLSILALGLAPTHPNLFPQLAGCDSRQSPALTGRADEGGDGFWTVTQSTIQICNDADGEVAHSGNQMAYLDFGATPSSAELLRRHVRRVRATTRDLRNTPSPPPPARSFRSPGSTPAATGTERSLTT